MTVTDCAACEKQEGWESEGVAGSRFPSHPDGQSNLCLPGPSSAQPQNCSLPLFTGGLGWELFLPHSLVFELFQVRTPSSGQTEMSFHVQLDLGRL